MAKNWIMIAFVLAVFALVAALFGPAFYNSTTTNTQVTTDFYENDTKDVSDYLAVEVTDVDAVNDTANVTIRNKETYATNSTQLDLGDANQLELSGDNVTVTYEQTRSDTSVILEVEHDPTFGWDSGPETFIDNSGLLILLAFSFIPIIGLIMLVVKQ